MYLHFLYKIFANFLNLARFFNLGLFIVFIVKFIQAFIYNHLMKNDSGLEEGGFEELNE